MCSHHNEVIALSQLQPVAAPATDTLLVLAAVLLHGALTKLSTWQGCVKSWTLVHPLQLVCVQRMVGLYESHYTLVLVVCLGRPCHQQCLRRPSRGMHQRHHRGVFVAAPLPQPLRSPHASHTPRLCATRRVLQAAWMPSSKAQTKTSWYSLALHRSDCGVVS